MISVSAFDLDHTLIRSNSALLFYFYLVRRGFFSPLSFFPAVFYQSRYNFFGMPLADLHRKVFYRFLKGRALNEIKEEVNHFLESYFYRYLYMPALSCLRRAQHQGHHTVVISSAPSFLVEPLAEYLGCSEWYSSHYLTDNTGILQKVGSILSGSGKARQLRKIIKRLQTKREKVTAYSDSVADLPFLYAAGRGIVVNPYGMLKKISKREKWEEI